MTLRRQFFLASTCFYILFTGLQKKLTAQATVLWSDPIAVTEAGQGTGSPRLALTDIGEPLIIWGKGGNPNTVRIARWQNGSFTTSQTIGTGTVNPGIFDFGGLDLAVRGDTVYVVFERFDQGIFLARSTDRGATFEAPATVFATPPGQLVTLPSVEVDARGHVLVSYLFENGNETNAIFHLQRSTDGGQTFLPPVNASAPAKSDYVCECCPSDIVTSGDSVWLAFRNLGTGNIRDVWVSRSTNQGAAFDSALDVDPTDWMQFVCPSSGPRAVLAGDSLVTVWMSRGTGTTRVHGNISHRNATEAGAAFTFSLTGQFSTQNHPDIAGSADTLGVVWEETGVPGSGTDIFFAFSAQGASALPKQIKNLSGITGTQKAPALVYRNGAFHLLYADVQSGRLWYRNGIVTAANPATDMDNNVLDLTLSPNPAGETVQVNWPENAGTFDLQLLDARGRVCHRWPAVSPGQNLALPPGLAPGFYQLTYQNERVSGAAKLLIR